LYFLAGYWISTPPALVKAEPCDGIDEFDFAAASMVVPVACSKLPAAFCSDAVLMPCWLSA